MAFDFVKRAFYTAEIYEHEKSMTVEGTTTKLGLLLATMFGAAAASWWLAVNHPSILSVAAMVAAISGIILAVAKSWVPPLARYTALPYALCQGLVVGYISYITELRYSGIVTIALSLTTATAIGMLLLYRLKIIQVTETVKALIFTATAGIALTYGLVMLLGLFGFNSARFFESTSLYSIGFSLFVVGVAAFNLLLDFALIEEATDAELPHYMEWYGAFTVLVTLIWLYIEILRLLRKVAPRK